MSMKLVSMEKLKIKINLKENMSIPRLSVTRVKPRLKLIKLEIIL